MYYIMASRRRRSSSKKVMFKKGGDGNVTGAPEGILANKPILASSEFVSTGTGGETAKYETAVSKQMGGKRRRSKRSKRCSKKWFGLF
jgi:hypothetical protein